ncbi:MAG: replicative DNA helicase [Bacillota bacterium]
MIKLSSLIDRVPPQNLEAEQSVLGSMLLEREAVLKAMELIRPGDFYREAHRIIYEAMVRVSEQGDAIDTITVSAELQRRGLLEDVGGIAYLTSLANAVPTAANVYYYARIVEEKARLRELLSAVAQISARVYEGSEDAEVLIDEAEQAIFKIAEGMHRQPFVGLKELLKDTFERVEHLFLNKGEVIGVPSGFTDLDNLTSGFHPSELIILAARPSSGKTTLGLNIACHAALNGTPTGVFSLEMSKEQLAQRILCSEAHVDAQRLRTGFLQDKDWQKLSRALGRLGEAPILVDDTASISVIELRARARRMRAEHDIGLIIVDYLQLMRTHGRFENRQQEVSEISRSLKALARELQIPVIALSQLSRAVEQRQDRRPQLSDLRESGAIEQDADLVMFIYFNPEKNQGDDQNLAEIIIAKQRNGPTGSIELVFRKDIGRFFARSRREQQGEGIVAS